MRFPRLQSRSAFVLMLLITTVVLARCTEGPLTPPLENRIQASRAASSLAAPDGLYVVTVSSNRLDLRWRDNSQQETHFEIQRSTSDENGPFIMLGTVGSNTTRYSDSEVGEGTRRCYRVRAAKASGARVSYSEYSSTACAATPLSAPSNASAAALQESAIDLDWQDNSSGESGFEVWRSLKNGSPMTLVGSTVANATSFRHVISVQNQEHCYRVRAVRVDDGGSFTSPYSNVTCAFPLMMPSSASGATARPDGSYAFLIYWIGVGYYYPDSHRDQYRIDRSLDDGSTWTAAGTSPVWSTSFSDPRSQVEQPVCYRVVTFNLTGEAPPSNTACTVRPAEPSNLTISALTAEIAEITWSDNSAFEDGYEVRRTLTYCSDYGDLHGTICSDEEEVLAVLPANTSAFRTSGVVGWEPYVTSIAVLATRDGGYSAPAVYVLSY